jgi:hypothetical protein
MLAQRYESESWGYLDPSTSFLAAMKSGVSTWFAQVSMKRVSLLGTWYADVLLQTQFPIVGYMSPGPANMQIRNLLNNQATRSALKNAGVTAPANVGEAAGMLLDEEGAIIAMAAHLKGTADKRKNDPVWGYGPSHENDLSYIDQAFVSTEYYWGNEGWDSVAEFQVDMDMGSMEKRAYEDILKWDRYFTLLGEWEQQQP